MPEQKGSKEAVQSLKVEELARHIPVIQRYLTKILRPDEIDDGTQTVLQRAIENLHRFRGESTPRVWLLGIARNVGFEIARARQRAPKLTEDGVFQGLDLVDETIANQEDELGRKEMQALALQALEGMSIEDKLALLITYADGLPGPQAAELLGVKFAAFRQRLSRARQNVGARLKGLMEKGQPGSADVMAQWRTLLEPEAKKAPNESGSS